MSISLFPDGLVELVYFFSNGLSILRPWQFFCVFINIAVAELQINGSRLHFAHRKVDFVRAPAHAKSRSRNSISTEWAPGKRQIVEGVIDQLKDIFCLERHRTKTLDGMLARLAAKVAAYTVGQVLNAGLNRPLRRLADLLI